MPTQIIPGFFFSKAAVELLPLITSVENEDYITSFAKTLKSAKWQMKYGKKSVLPNGDVVLKDTKDTIE